MFFVYIFCEIFTIQLVEVLFYFVIVSLSIFYLKKYPVIRI